MPAPDTSVTGAPCWVDVYTSDADKAKAFYGGLFGWTVDDTNAEQFGGYFTFLKDGKKVAGGMPSDGSGPDQWSIYLRTDDAVKTAEAAVANGGHVVVEAMPLADLGSMAVFADPGGAGIGTWQPGTHLGFEVIGEAGTPSWWELHTRDYDASVSFYQNVFNWTTNAVSDSPEFRYTVMADGEAQHAGIMDASAFLPEGAPAAWYVYFAVDDADAALAKVVELGGQVIQPAEDTPYGRLATAADPTGIPFRLVANTDQAPAS